MIQQICPLHEQAAISRNLSAILFFKGLHLELDNIVFHFSDFRLSLDPVLHRELVFLPTKHLTVGVSGGMSRPCKRPRLLQPGEISELVFGTDSDESRLSSDMSSVEGGFESVSGLSQPQPYRQKASSHESSSSVSSSASDKEDAGENGPGEQTQQPITLQWTHPSFPRSSVAHTYRGGPRGKKDNEASHINDGSSPLSVFLLYFAEIITLLVVETNHYYHDYIDRLDDGPSPEPDVTEAEMFVFLALKIQMGHGVRDKLTDYWATVDQLCTPFYGTMMKRDRYLHILRY